MNRAWLASLIAGLVGVLVGAGLVKSQSPPAPPLRVTAAVEGNPPGEIARAAEVVATAVVSIEKVSETSAAPELDPEAAGDSPVAGQGSGVFIRPDGYILTNNHVVEKAKLLRVRQAGKASMRAELVGRDPYTDLAVLKVEGKDFPYLSFGDSDKVAIGDWLVAVGNPYGYEHTVTVGVLSSRDRHLKGLRRELTGLLQTDAAINPGNSGGPLANLQGEIVGINTAIVAYARGIGFSVPSNTAARVAELLIKDGRVPRGFLGVRTDAVTPTMQELLGLPGTDGLAITEVSPGSPAAKAGLKKGQVLLSADGQPLLSPEDLRLKVADSPPKTVLKLEVFREGMKESLQVTLAPLAD